MPKADNSSLDLEREAGPIRKLPNMNEFSPGVLDTNNIRQVLAGLVAHDGDKGKMVELICSYPKINKTTGKQQKVRAANVLIGMSQCGLIQKEGELISGKLTPLAHELLTCADDQQANKRFARNLLENCYGVELLDAIAMIRARGEEVKGQSIRDELRSRGFEVTENEGNSFKIRLWLEGAKIIDGKWNVDETELHKLIGVTSPSLGEWHSLPKSARVFLEQLKLHSETAGSDWVSVRQIKKLAEVAFGRAVFPEGRLRAEVIDPLEAGGWIEARGKGGGRGGDSGDVKALTKLRDVKIKLPVDVTTGIPVDLRPQLSTPLSKIFADLGSSSKHVKGVALELLAIRLSRDIGLTPVCFRERSAKTQGAEVDLVANGVHLHYSRWLIQCKNTAKVHVHDVAKEVGMAVVMKAHVVALITTGKFSRAVQEFADGLASTSALQALLIDGTVLSKYLAADGNVVIDWLHDNAYRVLTLKEPQVIDIEEE